MNDCVAFRRQSSGGEETRLFGFEGFGGYAVGLRFAHAPLHRSGAPSERVSLLSARTDRSVELAALNGNFRGTPRVGEVEFFATSSGQRLVSRAQEIVVGFFPISGARRAELCKQFGLVEQWFDERGRFGVYRFASSNTGEKLRELRSAVEVRYAEPNFLDGVDDVVVQMDGEDGVVDVMPPEALWNRRMVGADELGKPDDGQGVVVAVVDGLADPLHPCLAGYWLAPPGTYMFTSAPTPIVEHGMAVASVIGGRTQLGGGQLMGLAPASKGLPIGVELSSIGVVADRARAIYFLARVASGVDVVTTITGDFRIPRLIVNCSWRVRYQEGTLAVKDAFEELVASPAICVCSAGNDGNDQPHYPSMFDGVVRVGAVDSGRRKLEMSNFGAGLDWVAPGGSGTPIDDDDIYAATVNSKHRFVIGTSFAAPHVAGVLSALWSRYPHMNSAELLALARASQSRPVEDVNPDFGGQLGNGLLRL